MSSVAYKFTSEMLETPPIKIEGLKNYQIRGVEFMLAAKRCINRGPTGSGKTVMALAAIDAANLYPAVIVCPASVKIQWASEVLFWLPGRSVSIVRGKTRDYRGQFVRTFVPNAPGSITGRYVDIELNNLNADIVIVGSPTVWDWAERLAERRNLVIAVDECAFLRNTKTDQSKGCRFLAKELVYVNGTQYRFGLSANTIVNRTSDLIGQLEFLDRLRMFGGWYSFVKSYCNLQKKTIVTRGRQIRQVLDYSGSSNEEKLNRILTTTCVFSVTPQEVFPEFEPNRRVIVSVDLDNWDAYNHAEHDFLDFVRQMAERDNETKARINALTPEQLAVELNQFGLLNSVQGGTTRDRIRSMRELLMSAYVNSATRRAAKAEALVKLGVLRRLIGIGKAKAVVDWLEDFHENNAKEKILIFAHNIDVQDKIRIAFPKAAVILGGQSDVIREANKQRFQSETNCTDCIISTQAGELGLNLHAAGHAAHVQLPDTYKTLTQCEGRASWRVANPHRIVSNIFIAPGTVDEKLLARLEAKKLIAERIEDGRESEKIIAGSIDEDLLDSMLESVININSA